MRHLSAFLIFCLCASSHAQALRAGAAAVALEADDSMVIAGGIGPAYAKGQEGELRAMAVVVQFGRAKVAIVACDVLFVSGELVDRALRQIERRTGIPPEHVLVNATHTHHAPSTTSIHGYGPEPLFLKRLESAIVDAVVEADRDLADASLHVARGEERTVGQNSRLLLPDNMIYWVGPVDEGAKPTGPFDPALPVLAFRSPDRKLRAVLFNHSTHTIGTRRPAVRSPSFYGLAAQELEAEWKTRVMFLEGASGSTHRLGQPATEEAIRRIKSAIGAALDQAKPHAITRLRSMKRPFAFKVRSFDEAEEERRVADYCRKRIPGGAEATLKVFRQMRRELAPQQGQERQTVLQAMCIGEIALVGVPGEYFTVLGLDIKNRSPFKNTLVAELANDWIGYLPDREAHRLGGYQTWMGLHSYAEPGTGERVADEIVKMLEELHRSTSTD